MDKHSDKPCEPFKPLNEAEIEEWRAHLLTNWQLPLVRENAARLCDMALASLSLPSPCGHPSQYAYSEDGGAHMVCLLCERALAVASRRPDREGIPRSAGAADESDPLPSR